MNIILDFLKTDTFIIILAILNIILIISFIANSISTSKIKKKYTLFMTKLGRGNDLEEMIKRYITKVEDVNVKNKEIMDFCKTLDNKLYNCIQKVGVVRYSAFKDTGSDLSFTLALLDYDNTGVVLNGIYSRETSNIYAKPVEKGTSTYTLSKEEQEAIEKAMQEQ